MKSNDIAKNLTNQLAWEEDERRTAEFERQRTELREEIKHERKVVLGLIHEAEAWQRAKTIRAYVTAAKAQSAREGTADDDAEWIAWAYEQADRLDPLRQANPSVLDTPRDEYRELGMNEYLDDDGKVKQA